MLVWVWVFVCGVYVGVCVLNASVSRKLMDLPLGMTVEHQDILEVELFHGTLGVEVHQDNPGVVVRHQGKDIPEVVHNLVGVVLRSLQDKRVGTLDWLEVGSQAAVEDMQALLQVVGNSW